MVVKDETLTEYFLKVELIKYHNNAHRSSEEIYVISIVHM